MRKRHDAREESKMDDDEEEAPAADEDEPEAEESGAKDDDVTATQQPQPIEIAPVVEEESGRKGKRTDHRRTC